MWLFKKKKQALTENEHYILKCNQCGQEVVHIPGEHTPEMEYFFDSKTLGVVSSANGCTIVYGGLQDFFTTQTSIDQKAIMSTTLADCIVTIHEHLVSHNNPLLMLFLAPTKESNSAGHTYISQSKGQIMDLKCLEYHGFDYGVLHDRGRTFEFNPNLWAGIVVATSPNIKIKGYPMIGTDYSKAVLPGIHLKRQTNTNAGDYQQQITMAVSDLSSMCGTAVLGGNLESNRDYIRRVGEDLYNAHGMGAMQEVFAVVTDRYPVLRRQLSSIWNGVGDWAD